MFLNSFVSVKYDDAVSKKWNLKRGVRQGGVLSAFLFCVYIDAILTSISQLGVDCKLGINVMNVQAYADDIVLMDLIDRHPSIRSQYYYNPGMSGNATCRSIKRICC